MTIKPFEIIVIRREKGVVEFYEKIEGDSLPEVLSKLPLKISMMMDQHFAKQIEEIRMMNDDIPF